MSFAAAVRSGLSQYVGFGGRARRSEYWWFVLFTVLIGIVTSILDGALGATTGGSINSNINTITSLMLFLPSLAVAVRRLHDTGRSGWWMLILLVPLVGGLVLLVFLLLDGTPGPNRFGASPKYHAMTG